MRQRKKLSRNRQSRFLKTEPQKLSFQFLNFEVGSVFRKPISDIFIGFHTPLLGVFYDLLRTECA